MMTFLLGVLASVAGGAVLIFVTPWGKRIIKKLQYYREIYDVGLRHFLPLSDFQKYPIQSNIFSDANSGDEILIVGRTLRWLIERRKTELLSSLRNGADVKV